MQIVIDIPEKYYKDLIRKDKFNDMYLNYYEKLIVHGTPLSKGHGRLKDVDQIEWYCMTVKGCPYKERECKDCDRAKCNKTQVDDIPTIIEEDKTESEE